MPKWEVMYLSKVTIKADTMEEAADQVQEVLEDNEGGTVLHVNLVQSDCGAGCGCETEEKNPGIKAYDDYLNLIDMKKWKAK